LGIKTEAVPNQSSRSPGIRSERAQRTRAALLKGAKKVFERDGYLDARISDIAKAARVAHGTFYTYFTSKDEVFREVVTDVQAELLAGQAGEGRERGPAAGAGPRSDDPVVRIESANRAYIVAYRKNAKLLGLLEQVSTFNDDLRRMRLDMRRAFVTRAAAAIARFQAEGVADAHLDPWYSASALCNMVDRFAYTWMVLGEPFEEERAIATLTRLWAQALQLETRLPSAALDGGSSP
jgi:AcrR family transcriptional regulator